MDCRHDWKPTIPGEKYRCALCAVRGYLAVVHGGRPMSAKIAGKFMKPKTRRATQIVAYAK